MGDFNFSPPSRRTLRAAYEICSISSAGFPRVSNGTALCGSKHAPRTNRFRDTRINKTFNRIHRGSNFLEDRRSISRFTAFDKLLIVTRGTEAEKRKKKKGKGKKNKSKRVKKKREKKIEKWRTGEGEGRKKKVEHAKQTSPISPSERYDNLIACKISVREHVARS